jgi:hypothetical protein
MGQLCGSAGVVGVEVPLPELDSGYERIPFRTGEEEFGTGGVAGLAQPNT